MLCKTTQEVTNKMMRKVRSDCRVGTFEKTRGLPPGTIRIQMVEIPEVIKR